MESTTWTDDELAAFLDEMLPAERMTGLEAALRDSEAVRRQLAAVARRRDQGAHSVGEIWRRLRISCPSRTELGSYLLGTLDEKVAGYVDFHVRTVGCRVCLANIEDLEQQVRTQADAPRRLQRFFESSAGYLKRS